MTSYTLHHGDCLAVLRTLPDASVDAVVTDPPYGLSFMGKRWDYDVPAVEVWSECLRVLKPGGYLLAFAGTRTQHRMACRIEDAGFDIRDLIAWVYGNGFPKSLDVSKAIDRINAESGRLHKFTEWMRSTGVTANQINTATGTSMASHYLTSGSQPAIPTAELWEIIRPMCGNVPSWVDDLVARISAEREVVGSKIGTNTTEVRIACPVSSQGLERSTRREFKITAPATQAARAWQGWGTALKPALEPITVARKPLDGTVAENVLAHGTGALNVDGCRVDGEPWKAHSATGLGSVKFFSQGSAPVIDKAPHNEGRWPANLIHDGSEEVVGLFPCEDSGSAARFFYCAKASKADRDAGCEGLGLHGPGRTCYDPQYHEGGGKLPPRTGNHHPTVKPTDLMRYLCRLITPPGGVVLDPFTGSGSTGRGAILEGFRFIGIEREADYITIARARIEDAVAVRAREAAQLMML